MMDRRHQDLQEGVTQGTTRQTPEEPEWGHVCVVRQMAALAQREEM